MKSLSARFLTTVIALLAATASHAWADFLYNSSTNPSSIPINATAPGGGGSLTLTPFTSILGPIAGSAGQLPVIAYTPNVGANVSLSGQTYGLTLSFYNPNDSATPIAQMGFTGSLSGSITPTTIGLQSSFTQTSGPSSFTLGGTTYDVTLAPSSLTAESGGKIFATITAVPGGGTPPPVVGGHNTPEPASLILGSLGFSFLGIGGWWKRSRRSPQPTA